MKTKAILSHSVGLFMLILTALTACTDHLQLPVTPGPGRLRVKSITEDFPNDIHSISLLRYDEQNRLSSIIAYWTPDSTVAPVEHTTYQYDGQNRLTGIRHELVDRGYPRLVEHYTYQYNAAGQVESLSRSDGYRETLRYNPANQLAGSSVYEEIQFVSTYQEDNTYTFTENNLISTTERIRGVLRGAPYSRNSTTTFTYDTKRNPFYGVYWIPQPSISRKSMATSTYYGGFNNLLNLSQNNVLTSTTSGTNVISYEYTYNAADLPTVRQTITSGAVTETVRFEYEPY